MHICIGWYGKFSIGYLSLSADKKIAYMGDYWYWPIWKNPYRSYFIHSNQLKTTYSGTKSLFSVLGHQQRLPQNSPSHVHPHYLVQLGALAYLFIILINNSKYRLNTKQPFFLISRLSFEATLVPSFIFFLLSSSFFRRGFF